MSNLSNNNGRAFEYITIITLNEKISVIRDSTILKNSSFEVSKNAWDSTDESVKNCLLSSANVAVTKIFELEPRILEKDKDCVTLQIQKDEKGVDGDVRDIIISRSDIRWEIGLSMKHNHFAVKHSRLSAKLDFGKAWYDVPCSKKYWSEIKPVFDYCNAEKNKGTEWKQLPNKQNDVYTPLLNAFINEVKLATENNGDVPKKMVEYLLGKYDFYKVVSMDASKLAQIMSFNLRGTLNQPSKVIKSETIIPISVLPETILFIGIDPKRPNTVLLSMDKGWSFSFRIHNASTKVEASLKFDIQIVGMPTTIITINCMWS